MKMDATTAQPKPFAWSYSRLKAFEDCSRRYHETQILKNYTDKTSDQAWGDAVHAAMAHALRTGTDLPTKFYNTCQKWIDLVRDTEGELLIEDDCQWAVNRELKPVPWFAKDVWLRCIADAVKLDLKPPAVALVVDWKAGKSSNVDPIQLTLTSLMMFLQFPKLLCVKANFVWLKEDYQTTQTIYRNEAADHWALLMPRVERLRQATLKENFPPIPGRLCKNWCPVSSCEFHGK
jgi:PD-(D/E)XK nuclease superfamily